MSQISEHPDRTIPRAVVVLGVVSLLMDMASEMLYPIAPLYLTGVLGASMAWVGIVEGIAEAVSGVSKGYFGALSDSFGRRRVFVTLGYGLSALSKPIPGIAASVGGVLAARVADRIGKGIRTAPRDALLAENATPETRGAVFGFHRAMDTVGAAIGPFLALAWLAFHPGDYVTLYLVAFIPAILATVATLWVRERGFAATGSRPGIRTLFAFWAQAPASYRRLVAWLTLFALVNSSDAFLLLRARGAGFSDAAAVGAYIAYNMVFALAAFPAGKLSDRLGRRGVMIAGMAVYTAAYLGFALASGSAVIWGAFVLYGAYAALTEGVAKAWISDMVPNEQRGQAIGLQTMLASLAALVASTWTGLAWDSVGHQGPLVITAVCAAVVGIGLAGASGMPAKQAIR